MRYNVQWSFSTYQSCKHETEACLRLYTSLWKSVRLLGNGFCHRLQRMSRCYTQNRSDVTIIPRTLLCIIALLQILALAELGPLVSKLLSIMMRCPNQIEIMFRVVRIVLLQLLPNKIQPIMTLSNVLLVFILIHLAPPSIIKKRMSGDSCFVIVVFVVQDKCLKR